MFSKKRKQIKTRDSRAIGSLLDNLGVTGLINVVEDTTPQLGGDLDLNGKNIDFPTTPNISDCLDEDDMVSDSATALATQQSIRAFVENLIAQATGATFFLETTVSDVAGYELLELAYSNAAEQSWNVTATGDDFALEEFITPAGGLGLTVLEAGVFEVHIHAAKVAGTKNATVKCKLYRYEADTTETLLGTSNSTATLGASNTEYELKLVLASAVAFATTDRLVWKFLVDIDGAGTDPSVTLYAQSTNFSHVKIPDLGVTGLYLKNLVEDLTPQLGGNLDTNGKNIDNVSPTELTYLDGVTSDIQTQLDAKLNDTQPYCFCRKGATQSINNASLTAIAFGAGDVEVADALGFHDPTTNNSRFTIPSGYAGIYHISVTVSWATNVTGYRTAFIRLNGAHYRGVNEIAGDTAIGAWYARNHVGAILDLAVGDYIEILVYQTSGGALNIMGNDPNGDTQTTQVQITRTAEGASA